MEGPRPPPPKRQGHVALFNVAVPATFKVDIQVVTPFNFVVPEKFKLERLVYLVKNDCPDKLFKLINIVVEVVFNFDNWVVWPLNKPNNEFGVEFKLFIDNVELLDNELTLLFKVVKLVA